MSEKILIIDDDIEVGKMVAESLEDEGYSVFCSENESDALDILKNNDISTVFLDLWFGIDENAGFKILKKLKKYYEDIPVIMISGHGNVENAVLAIKKGAYDFIEKPFRLDKLIFVTKRAIELYNLKKSSMLYENDLTPYLIGKSSEMQFFVSSVKKVFNSRSRLFFISDGVGLGADLIGEHIHNNSPNQLKKFVYINCANTDEKELINTILGVLVNGRYLNGVLDNPENGTVFFDNIFDMPITVQVKLLNYLKSSEIDNNIRIISSSKKVNIKDLISGKKFIEDLLYRLKVITLKIPAISFRKEDSMYVIEYFLKNSMKIFGMKSKKIASEAMILLKAYDWPGNVKQIKNIVEYLLLMSQNEEFITVDHIPDEIKYRKNTETINITKLIDIPIKDARVLFERYYIEIQMAKFSGHVKEVSKFIGMERAALHRKIKILGINEKYENEEIVIKKM